MKKKLMKVYLQQTEKIIGKRPKNEIAHDEEVITGLEMGLPIEAALANAAEQYPSEALSWDADSLDDIAAHFDYLRGHARILKLAQGKNAK
ncbi:MAG: hypothetical protein ACI9TH_001292 [Kiritimatiellia bacterium]|jgi:hypothetical protein